MSFHNNFFSNYVIFKKKSNLGEKNIYVDFHTKRGAN